MTGHVDAWRLESADDFVHSTIQEWHHFIVFAETGTLLLNISVVSRPDEEDCWRAILLWHDGFDWTSRLTTLRGPAHASADRVALDGHHVSIDEGGGWQVRFGHDEENTGVLLDVRPTSSPLVARNRAIAERSRLHWVLYPSVTVSGWMDIAGERVRFHDAAGYHDHNWGRFAWGEDFGWEWGITARDPESGLSVVFSALTNRAHGILQLQQVFVWRDGKHIWTARGVEVEREAGGTWPEGPIHRLPAILSVVTPPMRAHAPTELLYRARGQGRALQARVQLDARSQLLIPSTEDPLGIVVLNECLGTVEVRASLDGERFEFRAPCVFEILGGSRGVA